MKRHNKLFEKIIHKQNILEAHKNAKKGKLKYKEVKFFDENLIYCIDNIYDCLKNKNYKVSPYLKETRIERGKERTIYKLPYINDRVIHHALLQVIQPILEKTYIKDTYQSIKGRGVHQAKDRLESFLKNKKETEYCLKIDIEKFYPSVDNEILKKLIRKKIKCKETLWLIDVIVDSTKGLPIGNYTSQTFGNYYLSFFDHYVKEELKIKYYIRYADDMIFLSDSKLKLHEILQKISLYLKNNLSLNLKYNYQIFPTKTRGIDYLGFRFFGDFIILRKTIKKEIVKLANKIAEKECDIKHMQAFMSYWGWLKASDSYNLKRKIFTKQFKLMFSKISKDNNVNNPLKSIRIVSKKNINKYGKFQPNLLHFI